MRPKLLFGLCAIVALGVWVAPTSADPTSGPAICSSAGTALSGHYQSLRLTGNNYVAAGTSLTVRRNIQLAPGACLDGFSTGTVNVGGNVRVGKGAILGLGCAPGVDFAAVPCGSITTNDTIGGNLVAFDPYTMYLTAITIYGNLRSFGGGPGGHPAYSPNVNFPIKDNVIYGDAVIRGWKGTWFGFLRNVVSGNVVLKNISTTDPDSNENVTNTVRGNLSCYGNTPAVQFGDSGGLPNQVGGFASGQCGFGVIAPNPNYGGGGPLPISVRMP